jgi:hypothetical protein
LEWVIRNYNISCLSGRKWFSERAARFMRRKKSGKGKVTLFLSFTQSSFSHMCWRITWHPYLSYCLDLMTATLFSASDGYWCTHCCLFICIFLSWKTCIHSSEMSNRCFLKHEVQMTFSEKKKFETPCSIQYNRRHCYCFVINITELFRCTLYQQPWACSSIHNVCILFYST